MSTDSVETIVGRTDTWACNLATGSFILAWGYFLYAAIIANVGWLVGMAIIVPLSLAMYKLPVIKLVEPLSDEEMKSYLGRASLDSED